MSDESVLRGARPESPGRRYAQAWLSALIDSSEDAIVSKTLDGIVTTWNRGAEKIFGYSTAEMVGRPITTIIPPDRLAEETMILTRLRRGERVDHFQTVRKRKDGALIDISVTISPIKDEDGRVIGASKIARDITLWRRAHEELTLAKDTAERATELAELARAEAEAANRSKDYFLSVLSHELRTPLTPVLGVIGLLEKDSTLPAAVRDQLGLIRRNIETEVRLVDDLLDLTRISRGKISLQFEVLDAHEVVRSVLESFRPQMEERALALTVALRAKESHVWADAQRLGQVVSNLLSNAIKFTPAEGSLSVRTANEGDSLVLEVADSGVGIEPKALPRIFEPFEQGEQSQSRRFGGLGLGLAIVKSLIDLHRGSVSATSPGRDQGSVFSLRLPTAPAARPPQLHSGDDRLPKSRRCRVLLVEDHDDTRQVIGMLLASFGCEVLTAGSVKEAAAQGQKHEFDLVICDFGLPDGTGVDVLRSLKRDPPIRAIAMSGFGQDEDFRRSKEAGFALHLTKPVSLERLHRAVLETAP